MSFEGSEASVWDVGWLRIATDAAGIALWSWNVDTNEVQMDLRGHKLWGIPKVGPIDLETLSERISPPDRDRVRIVMEATRSKPGAYEVDFALTEQASGPRWLTARGLGADSGIVGRVMFSVFLDITERKLADEARDMLADEMSHRVKNLFAIASSLTSIAARSAATTTEMARDLTERLATLGRAHDLIRPDHLGSRAAPLADLLAAFLAPYDNRGVVGDRIHVSLPEVRVGEKSATTLALVVHELATNFVKYGSLSVAGGSLDVSCTSHNGEIAIVWRELGGPPVMAPSGSGGFGGKLLARSIEGQLGGTISFNWQPEGVVVTVRLGRGKLAT